MGDNIYTNNLILCFAKDLMKNAQALYQKRQSNSYLCSYPNYKVGLGNSSRLIIVGHGNPSSSFFMGDHGQWNAFQTAEKVRECLGHKIKRISFHMCCSAKAQQNGSIHSSFAYNFASVCDFADEITARTGVMNMRIFTEQKTGKFNSAIQTVDGSHRPKNSKVLYKPTGGNLGSPKPPMTSYTDEPVEPIYEWIIN